MSNCVEQGKGTCDMMSTVRGCVLSKTVSVQSCSDRVCDSCDDFFREMCAALEHYIVPHDSV